MDHDLKNKIKTRYGAIAKKVENEAKASCGCGPDCCSGELEDNADLYTKEYLDNLPEDAVRASLGCANPIVLANLKKGETVLDLGSGGGIDALISTKLVGAEGRVYGLDMTDEMLELANRNKEKMGVKNITFLKGYIEEIPLDDESVDVITSNCVINLCEDKEIAMKEAYRVLKQGGRLAIADIVQQREVPEDVKKSTEMWLGCIAGALDEAAYRSVLEKAGFCNIEIEAVNPYLDGAYAGSHIKAVKQAGHAARNIRTAGSADIPRITEIYNQGIEDRVATFETRLREPAEMEEWLLNRETRYPVLVIEDETGTVQGWAAVNSYNSRCCYSGVGDLSIYIERDMRGKGFGRLLLGSLMDSARKQGLHKLILNAFDTNEAAKKLYLALGFRFVGTYEKQGVMDGKYVDVTIMEKLLAEKDSLI